MYNIWQLKQHMLHTALQTDYRLRTRRCKRAVAFAGLFHGVPARPDHVDFIRLIFLSKERRKIGRKVSTIYHPGPVETDYFFDAT